SLHDALPISTIRSCWTKRGKKANASMAQPTMPTRQASATSACGERPRDGPAWTRRRTAAAVQRQPSTTQANPRSAWRDAASVRTSTLRFSRGLVSATESAAVYARCDYESEALDQCCSLGVGRAGGRNDARL